MPLRRMNIPPTNAIKRGEPPPPVTPMVMRASNATMGTGGFLTHTCGHGDGKIPPHVDGENAEEE